ncbi:MAG: hypothetical protein WD294_16665 [Phycisphaeraceae bacterium]
MSTQTTQADAVVINCPRCETRLGVPSGRPTYCRDCKMKLRAERFNPAPKQAEEAAPALPEEAACIHHPAKQAVNICAGSGDYICQLCSVDLNNAIYSAQYLEAGGKEQLSEAFDRTLPRPDRAAIVYLLCSIVFWAAPVLIPLAFYNYYRMFRLRATSAVYREMVSTARVVLVTVAFGAIILLTVVGFMGLFWS